MAAAATRRADARRARRAGPLVMTPGVIVAGLFAVAVIGLCSFWIADGLAAMMPEWWRSNGFATMSWIALFAGGNVGLGWVIEQVRRD